MIPGVRVYPTRFTPDTSNLKGKVAHGIHFVITERNAFDSARFSLEVAAALRNFFRARRFCAQQKLIGSDEVIRELQAGDDPRAIEQKMQDGVDKF